MLVPAVEIRVDPFIMIINNKQQVIGITSSGGPNCSLYSLYTSVARYSEWINKKTKIVYEGWN